MNVVDAAQNPDPIVIARQGSFLAGGRMSSDGDDTYRGDHIYVQYQVPLDPRPLPLIFWHGGSTSGMGWETTPDGREGFQTLLLRRRFATYIIDRPRKGRSGTSLETGTVQVSPQGDRRAWNIWRIGTWQPGERPSVFSEIQMAVDDRTIDQFLRQRTPNIGPDGEPDLQVDLDAAGSLCDDIGSSVLVTHSHGGKYGWLLRTQRDEVAGIVAYEPGAFIFPDDDPPADVPTTDAEVARHTMPLLVSRERFNRLASIPIQVVYGDNIGHEPSDLMGVEFWRVNSERLAQFADAIERIGGNLDILELPKIGIHGNTHFAFSDLNNVEIADLFVRFLENHQLA